MLRTMQWTGFLVLASLLTGCAHMYDVCDERMMKWRCCHEAKMAWLDCRQLYAEVAYPFDFGAGFRAGYESVCMGGDGCRPPMPPRHYWTHHYQCDDGKCQIMAWYDGYHHGALAAQCNGCSGRCNVLCASDIYGQGSCNEDFSELEHKIVPEDEMPNLPPHDMHYGPQDMQYGPHEMPYDGQDMYYDTPMDMHPGMPSGAPMMETPPAPLGPGGVPMAPGLSPYDVGTEVGPTLVPELQNYLSPGIDATGAPSF